MLYFFFSLLRCSLSLLIHTNRLNYAVSVPIIYLRPAGSAMEAFRDRLRMCGSFQFVWVSLDIGLSVIGRKDGVVARLCRWAESVHYKHSQTSSPVVSPWTLSFCCFLVSFVQGLSIVSG